MANKPDIKYLAKTLYLQVNSEGGKAYSLQVIADKILQTFKKKVHRSTIQQWAKEGNWNELYTQVKQHGVALAIDRETETESALLDKKSDDIADLYKTLRSLNLSSAKLLVDMLTGINSKEEIDEEKLKDLIKKLTGRDLIQLLRVTSEFLIEMNRDIPKDNQIQTFYDFIKAKYYKS